MTRLNLIAWFGLLFPCIFFSFSIFMFSPLPRPPLRHILHFIVLFLLAFLLPVPFLFFSSPSFPFFSFFSFPFPSHFILSPFLSLPFFEMIGGKPPLEGGEGEGQYNVRFLPEVSLYCPLEHTLQLKQMVSRRQARSHGGGGGGHVPPKFPRSVELFRPLFDLDRSHVCVPPNIKLWLRAWSSATHYTKIGDILPLIMELIQAY